MSIIISNDTLRPVKTCLLFFQLRGAFYAAERVRPEDLIVSRAKLFNASLIVLGRSTREKMSYARSVIEGVVKNKPAGCNVSIFPIPEGWKAGEPTISASDPEPEPVMKSVSSQSGRANLGLQLDSPSQPDSIDAELVPAMSRLESSGERSVASKGQVEPQGANWIPKD